MTTIIKNRKRISSIFSKIEDKELEFLVKETGVDKYSKKLKGIEIFKLLIFGTLTDDRASLRTFENFYITNFFKMIAKISLTKVISHSSIAERIAKINVVFFERLFAYCVKKYAPFLEEGITSKISSYDSTIVSISSKLLHLGMQNGQKNKKDEQGKLSLKFTIGFSNLPFKCKIHHQQEMISEDLALGDILKEHTADKEDIAVFDRGMKDRKVMEELSDEQTQYFVTRIYKDSKYILAEGSQVKKLAEQDEHLRLISSQKVHLFTKSQKKTKNTFRLIEGRLLKKDEKRGEIKEEKILFLSNLTDDFSDEQIAGIYRNRWKIEQYFRFIKQELNFKHFFSRNLNGIQVMMYVILIASILLLTYIKEEGLKGYKIPKRRFCYGLQDEIIKEIVIHCGGDPSKMYSYSDS